jgi:hypothetical protein
VLLLKSLVLESIDLENLNTVAALFKNVFVITNNTSDRASCVVLFVRRFVLVTDSDWWVKLRSLKFKSWSRYAFIFLCLRLGE